MLASLVHPWVFYLGFLALVLALFLWPRARSVALDLPTASLCNDLPSRRSTVAQACLALSWILAVACLVFALAGPRSRQALEPPVEGISLALVVDVSGSMANTDFSLDGQKISRLAGVQKVFRLLVAGGKTPDGLSFPGRPNDLISLVAFATRPDTVCPPTLDHAALLTILDRQTPKTLVTEAATNPGDAIAWALSSLQDAPTRRKAIVFFTDGESNVAAPALKPRQAGQLAANLKIPIYAIDALDEAEAGDDAPKAHQTLADLAAMTGGQHFRATDGPALLKALHELDRLERDAVAPPSDLYLADASQAFAIVAFICWFAFLVGWAAWGRIVP